MSRIEFKKKKYVSNNNNYWEDLTRRVLENIEISNDDCREILVEFTAFPFSINPLSIARQLRELNPPNELEVSL